MSNSRRQPPVVDREHTEGLPTLSRCPPRDFPGHVEPQRRCKALTCAQYGVLICIRCHDFRKQDVQVGLILYTLVPCCLMVAYLIELFAAYEARTSLLQASNRNKKDGKRDGSTSPTLEEQARFRTTWYLIMGLHFMNISAALVVTSLVVYYYVNHPLIGTIVEMHAIIVWLKTASYALTNRDFRHAYLHPQTGEREAIPEMYESCKYPKNITFGNLCYFWWAPTLVYQPVYPRNDKIRWLFVLKRSAEVLGLCVAMWILSAQYAAPTLQNSLTAFENKDVTGMLERLLKLSTISLVIWLAGFFALFQSFLNALAEVMRFGDRSFYDDCESAAYQVDALYASILTVTQKGGTAIVSEHTGGRGTSRFPATSGGTSSSLLWGGAGRTTSPRWLSLRYRRSSMSWPSGSPRIESSVSVASAHFLPMRVR